MKYGNILIAIAVIDVLAMFSGLPMDWKKGIVITTSVLLLFIGLALRAAAARRRARAAERARNLERALDRDLDKTVDMVARDVTSQVEAKIYANLNL